MFIEETRWDVSVVHELVTACVLHNICELHGDAIVK